MSKRARFVLVSIILGIGLAISQIVAVEERLTLILILGITAYVLTAWVLFEDLKGVEWVSLMILPVLFTLGAGLFANYLPSAVPSFVGMKLSIEVSRMLADVVKGSFFVLYSVGMYAILLTENIFSVASIRTIQLLRAARSVGFILSLVVGLFFFQTVLSLRIPFYYVGLIIMAVSFLLALSGMWSIDLKMESLKDVYKYSAIISWLMAQLGMVLAFWPIKALMGSLILVAGLYSLLGLFEQRMTNKMYVGNYIEYVVFSLIVVLTGFITTSWRG